MNNENIIKVTFERKEVRLSSMSSEDSKILEDYLLNYLIEAYENFDESQVNMLQKMIKEIKVAKNN